MTTTSAPYVSGHQPTRVGYWLAALVVMVGRAAGISYAVANVLDALSAADHFDRTTVGGSVTANVEAVGSVVVYVEASRVPALADLKLAVTAPSGATVAVTPYVGDLQYDRAGGLGTAVGTFTASEPGAYQVASGAVRTAEVIAVGRDIGAGVADAVGRAALICGLALAAGLALGAASWVLVSAKTPIVAIRDLIGQR